MTYSAIWHRRSKARRRQPTTPVRVTVFNATMLTELTAIGTEIGYTLDQAYRDVHAPALNTIDTVAGEDETLSWYRMCLVWYIFRASGQLKARSVHPEQERKVMLYCLATGVRFKPYERIDLSECIEVTETWLIKNGFLTNWKLP